MTNFITEVEDAAGAVETDVVNGLKAAISYVDNVVVTDLAPELLPALKTALGIFGSDVLSSILAQFAPGASITLPTPASTAAADTSTTGS
jgi:hypothetical protein